MARHPDSVCEQCKHFEPEKLGWTLAQPPLPGGHIWHVNDMKHHNCGLSKALLTIYEQTTSKGRGMIRYTPLMNHDSQVIPAQSKRCNDLVYFHLPSNNTIVPRSASMYVKKRNLPLWDSSTTSHDHFDARRQVFRPETANLSQARLWLDFCRNNHGLRCQRTSENGLSDLKVIDCRSKQVRAADLNEPYVTLSYVWGVDFANHADKHYQGGQFPKTIEDAMAVARDLGVPCLWVDRYCIDQSNEQERHDMIANMDKIYSGAEFTIIAAAGSNPHHGLPGVQRTPRHGTYRKVLSDGYLDVFADPVKEVSQSTWSDRAWTYQEMLLSPRRLVFTESQMLFECRSQDFRESVNLPFHGDAVSDPTINTEIMISTAQDEAMITDRSSCHVFPKNGIGSKAEEIYERIEEYSGKHLSYSKDRLNAMHGIFSAFRCGVTGYVNHFWGIPIMENETVSFLEGLCWHSPRPREASIEQLWPTWSWASASKRISTFRPRYSRAVLQQACVKVTHRDGRREQLCKFARGSRSYDQYRPWIDITTWVCTYADMDEYHWDLASRKRGDMYLTLFLFDNLVGERHFLLVEENNDGTYRRVGIATRERGPGDSWGMAKSADFRTVRIV